MYLDKFCFILFSLLKYTVITEKKGVCYLVLNCCLTKLCFQIKID